MSDFLKSPIHIKASGEILVSRIALSMGTSILTAIASIYFHNIGLTDAAVGYVAALGSLLAIVFTMVAPYLLEKYSEIVIYVVSGILLSFATIFLGLTKVVPVAIITYCLTNILLMFGGNAINIALKDTTSSKREFTNLQGIFGSLINFSWFVGPILGGLALSQLGTRNTLLLSGGFIMISAIIIVLLPIHVKGKRRVKLDTDPLANIKFYLSRKNLTIAYIQSLGVRLWWGYVWAFLPLFMLDNGYSPTSVGLVVGATQLPLFLFEFLTVKTVRFFGYRKIFATGFSLLTIASILMLIANDIHVVIGVTIACSLALSFLEPICELFVFDQVDRHEEDMAYPTYYTSTFAGSLVAKLGIAVFISLFGARSSYAFLAFLFVFVTISALGIKPRRA
ncbi:MFS transporter [Candidatus Saccharibacteria bacterium]|nr:MFS transporter [Candidatus Saccharibacteria bacterium]MCB9821189.1 MFS transporter [Candidatus Nomurabacteria bacterium]